MDRQHRKVRWWKILRGLPDIEPTQQVNPSADQLLHQPSPDDITHYDCARLGGVRLHSRPVLLQYLPGAEAVPCPPGA